MPDDYNTQYGPGPGPGLGRGSRVPRPGPSPFSGGGSVERDMTAPEAITELDATISMLVSTIEDLMVKVEPIQLPNDPKTDPRENRTPRPVHLSALTNDVLAANTRLYELRGDVADLIARINL